MFSDELSNAIAVSTHSRLKAAGDAGGRMATSKPSFNTQPPEGGWVMQGDVWQLPNQVSTHSRLKAAGPEN